MFFKIGSLNTEKAGRVQFDLLLWFFQKCIFQREGEALFFVTFNNVIRRNFAENFNEISQGVQKKKRIFLQY